MKTLLVFPTEREAASIRLRSKPNICGAGAAAGEYVRDRIARGRPDHVVLAGFCGGLDPSLGAAAMILGRQVVAPGLDAIEPDRRFAEDVRRILHQQETPFVFSRLLTVASPVADRTSKRDLWNEFGAGGVDMETYHVAAACHAAGIPWLAVRVVIDTASQSLPRSLASWSAEADNRRAGRVAATRPLEWPRYARLARQYPAAKRSLGVGVRAVVRAARSAPTAETLTLVEVH